jgi:uncharacterized Zn-binding protein involved in type VI secretion
MRAARLGDHIGHTSALGGLITGAAVGGVVGVLGVAAGAALAAGVGILAVFTAPVSIPLLIGGALVGAAAGAGIGEFVGSLSFISSITGNGFSGEIASGSPDVYINSREAARVAIDTAPCMKDPPVVALVAMGSRNVFINDHPAARLDDKVSCGAIIKEGSENVYIGGEQEKFMDVEEDVPGWMHTLIFGAGIAGALLLGGPAVIPTLICAGGLGMIGSDVLGRLGRNNSEWLSERFGGLPSDWENSGRFFGGGIGGWLGVKGARIAERLKFDRNTLFSIGGVPPLLPRRGPRHGDRARKLENELGISRGSRRYQELMSILRQARNNRSYASRGNYSLRGPGSSLARVSRAEADWLGRQFVGENPEVRPNGVLISGPYTDRSGATYRRVYRPPQAKPNSEFSRTGVQANFETQRLVTNVTYHRGQENVTTDWKTVSNGHIDVE